MNNFTIIILLLVFVCINSQQICDETLDQSSGSIKSPSYPMVHGKKTCTTNIVVPTGRWLKLTWLYFKMDGKMPDCTQDYVEVSIGCGSNKYKLSKFCSNNMDGKPHAIYSRDNCITLEYHTSERTESYSGGYQARYSSYTYSTSLAKKSCSRNSYFRGTSSGVIMSPNWPLGYTPNMFPSKTLFGDMECQWEIDTRDKGKLIKLNFMDVDVKPDRTCSSSASRIKVDEEKSILTNDDRNYYYCQTNPFHKETKFYELDIEMRVDRSRSIFMRSRGFVAGFVTYTDDDAQTKAKIGWIGGIVIVVIAIGIVIFCVIRRRKRQRECARVLMTTHATGPAVTTVTTTEPPQNKPYPQQAYPPQQYSQQPYQQQQQFPPGYGAMPNNMPPYQGYPPADVAPPPYPGNAPEATTYQPYPPQQQAPQYPPAQGGPYQQPPYAPQGAAGGPQYPMETKPPYPT